MECHLETSARHIPNSIRNYGRDLDSYRPGEPLADYKTYFERPKDPNDFGFETAHASYRLPRSMCFQKSQMTCLTCHDPHDIPRGEAATQHYIEVCQSCHASTRDLAQDAAHKGVVIQDRQQLPDVPYAEAAAGSLRPCVADGPLDPAPPAAGQPAGPDCGEAFVPDHTKVAIYYPKPATRSDADLYLAVAQVNDAGVDGIGNLRAILDRVNILDGLSRTWRWARLTHLLGGRMPR